MKVLIPDSIPLSLSSHEPDIEYITYSTSSIDFSAVQDAELLVVWMNTSENLSAAVSQLKRLRLVQTLAAGPDQVLSAGFREDIEIASGRGLHDTTVAEHALTLILSTIRNIDGLMRAQQEKCWDTNTINAQASKESSHLYTLKGAQVLIIGFGSIASHLAPMLKSLGASVTGVAQSHGDRGGFPVLEQGEMVDALPIFDVVISLLPYSQASEKYFNRNFFEGMKPSAIFINVGRGKTVDEIALAEALTSHRIRKAAIDVTYVEPLEIQSPLWEIPGLIITPHISGGRPQGSERLIESNARRLRDKSDLLNIITR